MSQVRRILVRAVCFPDGSKPWHAIQLPSGQLVVCDCGKLKRVSVVGLDGQANRSYGNKQGLQTELLRNPPGMALFSKQGCLLVAGFGNNRILALNSSPNDAQVLHLLQLLVVLQIKTQVHAVSHCYARFSHFSFHFDCTKVFSYH